MKNQRVFYLLAFFILIIFIASGCELPSRISDNITFDKSELTISFIDAGQGDATLIECGDETILIDASTYGERYAVSSYIANRGIDTIDYCVATHPHEDHIGGMNQIIYNFNVDTLVYPDCDEYSSAWNYVLDACDEKGVSYLNPDIGDEFAVGGATVTVLSPSRDVKYDNLNNYSLVLKLEYENVSFLFTGDAEKEVEKELINSSYDLSADVLKCGHHGSSTSSCESFIDAVNPSAAVISCGKDNTYGHPHDETLNTMNSRNIKVFRTDINSNIVACSDGETITFHTDIHINTPTATTSAETQITETNVIGNRNSKVYHTTSCGALSEMKENNKVYFNTTTEAENKGFSPCKSCHPYKYENYR